MSEPGCLFVIRKDKTDYYNIQIINKSRKEIRGIKKHNLEPVTLIWIIDKIENYQQHQQSLINLLRDRKIKDSWFRFKEDEIEDLKMKILANIGKVNRDIKNAKCKICGMVGSQVNTTGKFRDHIRQHAKYFVFYSPDELEKMKNLPIKRRTKFQRKRINEVYNKLISEDIILINRIKKFVADKPTDAFDVMQKEPLPMYISLSQDLAGFSSSVVSKLSEIAPVKDFSF